MKPRVLCDFDYMPHDPFNAFAPFPVRVTHHYAYVNVPNHGWLWLSDLDLVAKPKSPTLLKVEPKPRKSLIPTPGLTRKERAALVKQFKAAREAEAHVFQYTIAPKGYTQA